MCIFDKGLHQVLAKIGGIWTTCRISKLCAFIFPEWSLSRVPLVPAFQQSRVRRLGRLPLSPSLSFHPATPCPTPSTPFPMQEKGSRFCTCFVTSVPLRLRRLDRVSSNSPRERHFQPCYQHLIGAWWTWGWGGYRLSELVKMPLSPEMLSTSS